MKKIIIVSMLLVALGASVRADPYEILDMINQPALSPAEVDKCVNTYLANVRAIKPPEELQELYKFVQNLDPSGKESVSEILILREVDLSKFTKQKSELIRLNMIANNFYYTILNPARASRDCIWDDGYGDKMDKILKDKGSHDAIMINLHSDYMNLCEKLLGKSSYAGK